ncbi:PIG-L deacetylase family protein [Georgenia yuyongxinii]|uniref:PIG-L family deacetylase n=1 Tax=Georgenia yuyongxinii TaxID=2589797 RepID=A0A552WY49_9MICO|nr:PIG-L family deacetylase [Georgenia yuyongxinii]TRW47539.1 PIG-L family deacetylase [Georgenia yuyongxinii]
MRHSLSRIVSTVAVLCLGLLVVAGSAPPSATAAGPRTTVIVSPHPDDETLRLTGYIRYAVERGDRLILVAVTDGGASAVRAQFGFTVGQLKAVRRAEQVAAWSYLTDNGQVIRLGLEDGAVAGRKAAITARVKELAAQYGPTTEFYVAALLDDDHPDHSATAEAVRDGGARVVRYSRGPVDDRPGSVYRPTSGYLWGAQRADAAYDEVGYASAGVGFVALEDSGYASVVVP